MAKGPTKQHYVPACYLREWVDPNTPPDQDPYLWIFKKGEKKGKKRAPSNSFTETDLYTLKIDGKKDYSIEEALSTLEGRYASVFRNTISKHLPLNDDDHITLCVFAAAMLYRTLRHKHQLEKFFDELIQQMEAMEHAYGRSA